MVLLVVLVVMSGGGSAAAAVAAAVVVLGDLISGRRSLVPGIPFSAREVGTVSSSLGVVRGAG